MFKKHLNIDWQFNWSFDQDSVRSNQSSEETKPTAHTFPMSQPDIPNFAFGELQSNHFRQNWGNFYTYPFPPFTKLNQQASSITNQSSRADHNQHHQEVASTISAISEIDAKEWLGRQSPTAINFSFGTLESNAFKVKWGKFYRYPFAGGTEFEVKKTKLPESQRPSTSLKPTNRSNMRNPIDLIEEIVQEYAEPLPNGAELDHSQPSNELSNQQEIIAESPEEIRLRRLKLKAMGTSGKKLMALLATSQEQAVELQEKQAHSATK